MNGLCECGCGGKTNIISGTQKNLGLIKGVSYRFIRGHNSRGLKRPRLRANRISYGRYARCFNEKHPRSKITGYVSEHVLIVEKTLGKFLPLKAVVHHINGDGKDNDNKNLVICENNAYHNTLHRRERAFKACGHAHWRKCQFCKNHDDPLNLYINEDTIFHKHCASMYYKKKYQERRKTK